MTSFLGVDPFDFLVGMMVGAILVTGAWLALDWVARR